MKICSYINRKIVNKYEKSFINRTKNYCKVKLNKKQYEYNIFNCKSTNKEGGLPKIQENNE